MSGATILRRRLRLCAAWGVLLLPGFSYPLGWLRLWRDRVEAWPDAVAFPLPLLALAALAVVAIFPEVLIVGWRRRTSVRLAVVGSLSLLAASLLQHFLMGGSWNFAAENAFFALLPLAGIALAPELKRIFPLFGVIAFAVLIVFTVRTRLFVGLPGNWNWNIAMLALLAPAVVLFFKSGKRRLWFAVGLVLLVLLVFSLFYFTLAPRGVMVGMVGAAAFLWVVRRIPPRRRFMLLLLAMATGAILFVGFVLSARAASMADSRVQLWRGSLEFALAHAAVGVGAERFGSMIAPWLPPEYFSTPFIAEFHPHPHNELLFYLSSFGVAGIFFLCVLLGGVVKRLRRDDPAGMWLAWVVFALFIHAQFDMLLSMPLTGSVFLLGAGTLLGNGLPRIGGLPLRTEAVALGLATILLLGCGGIRLHAGLLFRRARIHLASGDGKIAEARAALRRANALHPAAASLYLASRVELFDCRDPHGALAALRKLSELGYDSYEHSHQIAARAHAVLGDTGAALEEFALEEKCFPFSAINAGLELAVLTRCTDDPVLLAARRLRFAELMALRGLQVTDFPRMLKNPAMDDTPLPWQAMALRGAEERRRRR